MSIRQEIREQFQGMNREELLNFLREAGFNVKEGTGKITIYDEDDNK